MVGAGVIGFGARAAGVAPGLGETPPHMATAVAALAVGALWEAGWAVAAIGAVQPRGRNRHDSKLSTPS